MKDKISQYLMIALAVIGVIMTIVALRNENYDVLLYYSYILFGVTVVLVILAAVATAVVDPSKIKGTVIGIVGMAAIMGLGYALASGDLPESYGEETTANVSRWSGAGLYAFYILFIGAFAAVGFSSFSKMFK